MKTTPNDIVLRPRFQIEIKIQQKRALELFKNAQRAPFKIKQLDQHVFIKFDDKHMTFWSPQLHLEIDEIDNQNSKLYGIFGPSPSLWTFFMFLHFGIATLAIIFGIWGYSNWSLNQSYILQISVIIIAILIWLILYFFGRLGKVKGKPQMEELYLFMKKTVSE